MFGVTPKGNPATPKLVDQYKRYAIAEQESGRSPIGYEEWVKKQIEQTKDSAGRYF